MRGTVLQIEVYVVAVRDTRPVGNNKVVVVDAASIDGVDQHSWSVPLEDAPTIGDMYVLSIVEGDR